MISTASRDESTNVVLRGEPFHRATAPETKPAPFTASVKGWPPAVADEGKNPVIAGEGPRMGRTTPVDCSPPAFRTVTTASAGAAIRARETEAVSCVFPTYEVVSGEPFHRTVADGRNPEPLTVRVRSGPPAVRAAGCNVEMTGTAGLTAKLTASEVEAAPDTVTATEPAAAMPAAGTTAVSRAGSKT